MFLAQETPQVSGSEMLVSWLFFACLGKVYMLFIRSQLRQRVLDVCVAHTRVLLPAPSHAGGGTAGFIVSAALMLFGGPFGFLPAEP